MWALMSCMGSKAIRTSCIYALAQYYLCVYTNSKLLSRLLVQSWFVMSHSHQAGRWRSTKHGLPKAKIANSCSKSGESHLFAESFLIKIVFQLHERLLQGGFNWSCVMSQLLQGGVRGGLFGLHVLVYATDGIIQVRPAPQHGNCFCALCYNNTRITITYASLLHIEESMILPKAMLHCRIGSGYKVNNKHDWRRNKILCSTCR